MGAKNKTKRCSADVNRLRVVDGWMGGGFLGDSFLYGAWNDEGRLGNVRQSGFNL